MLIELVCFPDNVLPEQLGLPVPVGGLRQVSGQVGRGFTVKYVVSAAVD